MVPAELDEVLHVAGEEPVVRHAQQVGRAKPADRQGPAPQESAAFLATALGEAYEYLRRQVEGLTAEEFFWEPAPECWSLRELEDGGWSLDYVEAPPVPAPVTTIAWRMVHVAACKLMYYEYAFGPAHLTWDELLLPGTVDGALVLLKQGQQQLLSALMGLTDADLPILRATNWGEQWPTWRIFWTMITHDLEHGAEIGLLRQLYPLSQRREGEDE